MKTKFRNTKLNFAAVLIIAVFFLLSGCADSSDSDATDISEIEATFTAQNGNKLKQSVLDMPESLTPPTSPPASGARYSVLNVSSGDGGDGGMEGIYSGIPHYIQLVEMMNDMVEDIMYEMLSDSGLRHAKLGEEIIIPEDPQDPEAPRKVMIEKPKEEGYEWKISLFSEEDDQTPDAIIRFTLEGLGAKGRVLMNFSELDENLRNVGIDITIDRKLDISFDKTGSPQTLEVKIIQDLDAIINYATDNWGSLSSERKEALDLGQPDRVFVTAWHDGVEFTIYGASHHPGWETEAQLENEDMMFNDSERTMYMFKAKAVDGEVEGAKLYLALPRETRSAIDNLWSEDSVGNIITDSLLNQFNEMIAKLADATDDPSSDGENPSLFEEQERAVIIMCWMIGDSACTKMASHDATFSGAEYANLQAYYSDEDNSGDYAWLLGMSLDALNTWYSDLSDDTNPKQSVAYFIIMLPTFKSDLDASDDGYSIAKDQLEDFIYADASGDQDKANMQDGYSAIKYMINPAFYTEQSGFLGTWDESKEIYYQFSSATLTATDDTNPIDDLKDLDLSFIDPYAPTEVISTEITVE